jgi:tetratricopeptide (TPR) repeat protein
MRDKVLKRRIYSLLLCAALVLSGTGLQADSVGSEFKVSAAVQNALNAGDTTLAIDLLNKDIAADPNYHTNYFSLGYLLYQRGDYDRAAIQFQRALEKKDKHWESLLLLTYCQIQQEKYDEALTNAENGLKRDRNNKGRWENVMGMALMGLERYADADAAFRRALVVDDNNAEYHINLGDANFRQGIPSLAVVEYERALQLDTAGKEVYFHWAEACLDMKDYNCAIEKLRIVLTKDSTYAPAWNRAGHIYFRAARSSRTRQERTDRFRDAIGSYKKYFELANVAPDSSTVRPYFETAMAYSEIYGFEDAVEYFDKVLAIPYEPRDIYFYYGKALWGVKEYDRAAEMLQKQLDWQAQQTGDYRPTFAEAELNQLMGDSYYYRRPNDFSTALTWYKKSLSELSDQKRIIYNVAVANHQLKRYREALQFYDQRIALGMDSASSGVYKNAGSCALNVANEEATGEDDLMEEEMGVAAEPDTINYYEKAAGYFVAYLEYEPNDERILELAGTTVLYQLADCNRGVALFERLLSVNPKNCVAKRSLGFAYFGGLCTKNYNKAIAYLTDAYECQIATGGSACSDVTLALYIAQAYHLRAAEVTREKADYKNAFEWYGKVLKCEPGNADAQKGQNDTQFEF